MTDLNEAALADSELTRPIISIENRSAQEVFDIMSDRFNARITALSAEVEGLTRERDAYERGCDEWMRDAADSASAAHQAEAQVAALTKQLDEAAEASFKAGWGVGQGDIRENVEDAWQDYRAACSWQKQSSNEPEARASRGKDKP